MKDVRGSGGSEVAKEDLTNLVKVRSVLVSALQVPSFPCSYPNGGGEGLGAAGAAVDGAQATTSIPYPGLLVNPCKVGTQTFCSS